MRRACVQSSRGHSSPSDGVVFGWLPQQPAIKALKLPACLIRTAGVAHMGGDSPHSPDRDESSPCSSPGVLLLDRSTSPGAQHAPQEASSEVDATADAVQLIPPPDPSEGPAAAEEYEAYKQRWEQGTTLAQRWARWVCWARGFGPMFGTGSSHCCRHGGRANEHLSLCQPLLLQSSPSVWIKPVALTCAMACGNCKPSLQTCAGQQDMGVLTHKNIHRPARRLAASGKLPSIQADWEDLQLDLMLQASALNKDKAAAAAAKRGGKRRGRAELDADAVLPAAAEGRMVS